MPNPFAGWTADEVSAHNAKVRGQKSSPPPPPLPCGSTLPQQAGGGKRKQTKTEIEAGDMLRMEFSAYEPYFEGLSFRLRNGHKYTPDWVVRLSDDQVLCVEVKHRGKDGFRQASYQRARVMFDQCRVEWNNYIWRWMEKHNGEWDIKDY
jgi:hypothetical protein